ncbi:Regulator of telomere elongation helicase 1 [Carabus blaptoides fortunei]
MSTVELRGVPVAFPFKPYDIQKNYMEKVIECLQDGKHGVLESPTGTGKTLSLLCSSLAWLTVQKAKLQAERRQCGHFFAKEENPTGTMNMKWDIPTIIYSSRTHSQLIQAMQELKRTSYSHLNATILGSREQLCIHPEVSQQASNSAKTHMCQMLVKKRSCMYQNRVEQMTTNKTITEMNIADIEDLIKVGQKMKFCPYYMTKELKKSADIVFLPYNYLLDPKARRAQQLDLRNSVIILDEAHNVERICEDSASFQIRTTDITLCIEEVTQVMKHVETVGDLGMIDGEKDFSAEDLILLKTMLLDLEKVIDEIPVTRNGQGSTFEGKYIFEILRLAGINDISQIHAITLLDSLIQFMSTTRDSPFQRTGTGLQMLHDLLLIVFQNVSTEFKERINQCYKVHLIIEDTNKKIQTDTWLKRIPNSAKQECRVLSYWCFSPNFGMQMLLEQGVRCVILTSGTLAPLKPLISELGITVDVRLENPHVVTNKQICVKILGTGPDGTPLNAGFQNRDNPKYIRSLGMTISNLSRQIPHGLLIFFPSYALLNKCQESWQTSGLWSSINELKMVFVEPKTKNTFNTMMVDFYDRVKNPAYKGAIFMAVCRGKVSEGLDFSDMNGRAVIVTGLPYPPFKDPRVTLKREYLDICRSKNSEYLSGQDWYSLEATRAVNQAIGRVIRHRHDYGAILLLDNRFNNYSVRNKLSLWLRDQISLAKNFGEVIREMKMFFNEAALLYKNVEENTKNISAISGTEIKDFLTEKVNNLKSCSSNASTSNFTTEDSYEDTRNKRTGNSLQNRAKRKKIILVQPDYENESMTDETSNETVEFISMMKKNLETELYSKFTSALSIYKGTSDIDLFIKNLNEIFGPKPHLRYLIQGMLPYISRSHKSKFLVYWEAMR